MIPNVTKRVQIKSGERDKHRNPEWVALLDQGEILAHQALVVLVLLHNLLSIWFYEASDLKPAPCIWTQRRWMALSTPVVHGCFWCQLVVTQSSSVQKNREDDNHKRITCYVLLPSWTGHLLSHPLFLPFRWLCKVVRMYFLKPEVKSRKKRIKFSL